MSVCTSVCMQTEGDDEIEEGEEQRASKGGRERGREGKKEKNRLSDRYEGSAEDVMCRSFVPMMYELK